MASALLGTQEHPVLCGPVSRSNVCFEAQEVRAVVLVLKPEVQRTAANSAEFAVPLLL